MRWIDAMHLQNGRTAARQRQAAGPAYQARGHSQLLWLWGRERVRFFEMARLLALDLDDGLAVRMSYSRCTAIIASRDWNARDAAKPESVALSFRSLELA